MTSVVFSGHMVDAPDRPAARFPADRVLEVRRRIEEAVAEVDDRDAVAASGAASGGDLIFAEAWLSSGRRLTVFLPREVEAFLDESVRPAGDEWEAAFHRVLQHPAAHVVGPEPGMDELANPHTLNNLRMLERAREAGSRLRGIFLWDGAGGDGPGGTRHMADEVESAGGHVTVIEP